MCEYCVQKNIVICYESESGKHYGYCGGFIDGDIKHFAIKTRNGTKPIKRFQLFKFCPMCGRNLNEENKND